MSLTIHVTGTPAPRGSKRAFVVNGRAVMTESSKKVKPWRQDVTYAAANAEARAEARADRLARAHRIIDRFEELTGVKAAPVPEEKTAEAVAAMTGARP